MFCFNIHKIRWLDTEVRNLHLLCSKEKPEIFNGNTLNLTKHQFPTTLGWAGDPLSIVVLIDLLLLIKIIC